MSSWNSYYYFRTNPYYANNKWEQTSNYLDVSFENENLVLIAASIVVVYIIIYNSPLKPFFLYIYL